MIVFLYDTYLRRNLKSLQRFKFVDWQLFKFFRHFLVMYYKHKSILGETLNDQSPIIVSLTSLPQRIDKVPYVIKSMFLQTTKPQKIILWLGTSHFPNGEQDLPKPVLDLKKNGLEICFVEDLKPHTKYYYAFQKYPNHAIVTIDDDLFYPRSFLETLLETSTIFPEQVIAHRVREVGIQNNQFLPYRKWKINPEGYSIASKQLMATGVGGVLYHPEQFSNELYDQELLKTLCFQADDIWLKAHQVINQIKVVYTGAYKRHFIEIPRTQTYTLNERNVFEGGNDLQIARVFNQFNLEPKNFKEENS